MKATKIIGKIILIIIIIIILLVINVRVLIRAPGGITLPWGWEGECYGYKHAGFPFSVLSFPPPGALCLEVWNFLAFTLNFLFLILLTLIAYLVFRRIITKK